MANLDRSFLASLCISNGGIRPFYRQQHSRSISGNALTSEIGDSLWQAEYITDPMQLQDAMEVEAQLISLNGSIGRIALYDVRRDRPLLHTSGSLTRCTLAGPLSADRFVITMNCPLDDILPVSIGDWFSVSKTGGQWLHKVTKVIPVTDPATSLPSTTQISLEIWPARSFQLAENDTLVFHRPFGVFQLHPDSLDTPFMTIDDSLKQATISFRAIQMLL